MKYCPTPQIKNSEHFQKHIEALGEPLTYFVYDKNGGNLLSEGKTATLYKQILDKTNNKLLAIKLTAKVFGTATPVIKETKEPVTPSTKPQRGKHIRKETIRKLDSSKSPSLSPNVVKQGVDFVFEQNPELTNIGTQEQYSQYLDTIFPDSKVKDVVYHGANEPIEGEKFIKREGATGGGIWFSGSKKYAQIQMDRAQPSESLIGRKLRGAPTMYSVLLNIKNPKNFYDSTGALLVQTPRKFEEQYNRKINDAALFHHPNSKKPTYKDSADQVVVFEPEQIHILGSKQDIEGFKNFVKEQPSASPSENLSITSLTLYDNLQQENDIINSLTSTALNIIDDIKGGDITTSLTDVLDQVKQELQDEYDYFNYFSENQPDAEDIANGARSTVEQNKVFANRFKFVLDNFEKVKEGDKVKYVGIRDRIANKINSLKFSVNEDLIDETDDGLEKESYEDSWMQKISAENSMSAQVKRLLSFIPARDFKGSEKSNTIGYKVYEDYTKVYSLIQNMLVDIPIEYIYDELVELSSKNVIVKDVLVALDKLKETSSKDYNNFHVTMRRQEANFITVLANPKDKNNKSSYQAFTTNQANASDNVINIWHEGFKTKGLESGLLEINKETGALLTNVDKAKEIYKEFDTNFKEKDFKKRLEIIASSLNKIGIDITAEDLEELNKFRQLYNGEIAGKTYLKGKNNRYSRYYKAKTFNDFIGTELKPIFLTLTGQLKDDSATTAWETNNPYFSQTSRMKGLTSYYLTKNPDVANSSTFRNGNGDLIQGIMMPHYASNRMYKITNDENLRTVFKEIPFTKHATWLEQDVKMRYFDSASMRDNKQDSKNYADQSPSEKEFTKIALFQNSGRNKMLTIGNTPSDKTMFKLFEVDRHDLNLDNRDNLNVFEKGIINKDNIDLNSPTINTLYTLLVQSEINRIISVRRAFKEKNIKDLIAGYHYLKNNKGESVVGAGGYFYFVPELNDIMSDYIHDGQLIPGTEGEAKFREVLRDKLVQLIEDKVQSWNEKGVVNLQKNTHNFDKSYAYNIGQKIEKNNSERNIINKAAADMVINYMMNYANEFQLITGDPALFAKPTLLFKDWKGLLSNTADNIFKRTAKDIAPGLEGKFEDTTFKSIFINEPTVTSAMATYADRIGVDLSKKYDKLDIADAQEWTTLKEHLNVLHAYGKIDKQTRDNLINKAKQRLELSKISIFEPLGETLNVEIGEGTILGIKYKGDLNKQIPLENREFLVNQTFKHLQELRNKAIKKTKNLKASLDSNGNLDAGNGRTIYIKRLGLSSLEEYKKYELNKIKEEKSDESLRKYAESTVPKFEDAENIIDVQLNKDGSISGNLGGVGIALPNQLRNKRLGKNLYRAVGNYLKSKGKTLKSDPLGHSEAAHRVWESFVKSGEAKIVKGNSDDFNNGFYTAQYEFIPSKIEDYNFTWEELGTVLQPVKPVYVSSKYNPDLQVDEQYYIKTSSFPLIPQLTEDLEIDKLRVAMESLDNNIDRAVVFSGVKLGFTKGVDIFDENGDVNIPSNLKESIQDLPRDGFRIQQEVPYDVLKEKILEGSQLRKLAFANLTPNMNFNFVYGENKTHKGYQLKQLSDNIHNRLYELKYNQLLKDLGVPEGQNTITDVNKLKDVLEETATELGYNINDILMLTNTITLNGGRVVFEIPLFFHNQSNKIESMLNSIIKNRVLKNKMPGKSFVQGSSVGFNTTYKMRNEKFLETMLKTSKKRIVYTKNAEGKRNFQGSLDYREYEENGQKIIYAEVFAPFNFIREGKKLRLEDYTDEQGFIKQDKIDNELLNILGYRIPTQGHSSMMKLKVVGFLPQEAGDLIIVPAAITKQMGSDFDVDKLYTHNLNYKFGLGGRIEKITYSTKEEDFSKLSEKELQNMMMDIYFSILDNPDVQNKYQFVLTDDPTLKNDKAKLNEYRENIPKNTLRNKPQKSSLLYDEYQAHMVEVNAAGKIGIGSYSSASANHILFQYAGVYLKVPTNSKGKLLHDKAVSVKFKDEKGNIYTDNLNDTDDTHLGFKNNRVNNINTIEYTDNVGEGAWRLDKVYTFSSKINPNGKLISDVIKSYQSSSVDNAKDQNLYDLHQNKHTFSVSWLIARTGFDEYFINRFVSQPAIIKYVEGLNNLDNYTDNEFDPTKKLKLQQRLFAELGQNFDEWGYGITAPSLSEMETAIKDNGADKLFQAQMLWNFIKYAEVASEISRVQTSANTDTAFLGKSIYESILKQSIINEKKQFLGNTDNLFKETTQQGAVTYGLNASVDLFSSNNLFPIKSTAVLSIFDTIKNELDKDIREDIAFNIVSDIRASLFSNAVIDVYGKDINTVRRELLFGDNSLAKRLKVFQSTTTNPFFKVLQVITGATKDDPDVIEFSSSKDIRDELDISMLLGWNNALNSSNEQERQLAEDLVLYSLINGNQRNARDFGRFLPYDYIANKLAPYYRKLDFDNSKEGIDLLEANFTIQWFQHNPYRSRETVARHWEKAVKFDGKEVGENEAPDIITLKSIDNPDIEQLMSYNNGAQLRKPLTLVYKYKDSKGKSQTALYKQQDSDYVRIPVLGLTTKLIKEYNISNPNQQSVFREPVGITEKKITITLEPKLPESKKEQDLFDSYNYNGGINSVLESIVANSKNKKYQAIAKFYLKHKDLIRQYKLDFYDSKRTSNLQDVNDNYSITGADGRIWYDDMIILSKDTIKDSNIFERVFLHEVTHALVHARLGSDHKANKQLQSIMDELKKHSDLFTDIEWLKKIGVTKIGKVVGSDKEGYIFGDYIFTDTQEFAAALMTDKDLYKILYNIPYGENKSFWDRIKEFIVNLLGFNTGDTLLTEGMSTVLEIIENQNFEITSPTKESINSITFNDGTKISTGNIQLNSQQEEALKMMGEFVTEPSKSTFALKGYAGTGKTTILNILRDYIQEKSVFRNVVNSSPTHRANAVMKQKGARNVYTLHSVFGLSPEIELEKFDSRNAKFVKQNNQKIGYGDLLIIDESSMINDELYKFIVETAKKQNVQVIFVGDPAQLKPVKQETLSKAFSATQNSYELTKVERTGDNPLLKESMDIRNKINKGDFSNKTELNSFNEGVVFTNDYANFLQEALNIFSSAEFKSNPLLVRMLSATNNIVDELNNKIRLGIWREQATNEYNPGEIIMGYANWKADRFSGEPLLANSGDYQILKVEETTKNIQGKEFKGYDLVIKDLINNSAQPFNTFMISKNTRSEDFEFLGSVFEQLVAQASALPRGSRESGAAWARLYAFKDSFMTPVDVTYKGRSKINATFKYGYAHTIHKSQGGTYKYSFVHSQSIDNSFKEKEANTQLKYVAVTRAEKAAFIYTNKTQETSLNDPDLEYEFSLSPSGKVYPMKPYGRVFKLAIDKNGHYIPEIANSENKRRIVNEHFRFRGSKDFNSANKPYTTFTKGSPKDDINLVHEINNQYTGRVVAYHSQTNRIIFTPDVDNYTLKGDQLQFEFSSSPMESTLFSEQKLINIKKTQLEIFKSRLTEKGVNREDLKKKISILEAQIEKLTTESTQKAMEEVTKKTLESVSEALINIQGRLNSEPSEEELYNIFTDLRDVDIYLEGMLNIGKLIEYEGDEAIHRIDILQANINRERAKYLEQIKQATVQFAHKVGSERFKDISEEDLFADVEDISFAVRETLNMANSPSMLVRLMHQIIQLSKQNMLEEQRKVATSVDSWETKLKNHTKLDSKDVIDIFKQKYQDGSWTGNFISKYKQEFFDTRNDIWNKVNEGGLTVKDAMKWLKDNTTLITKEELDSGVSSIFTEEEMAKQKELLEKYKEDEKAQREALENTYITEDGLIDEREVDARMDDWIQRNSPEIYLSYYHDNKFQKIRPKGYKYLIYAKPKDKWLDERFDRIQNDKVLLDFYNFMVETFENNNKALPFITKVPGNYLPEINKTFVQKIKDNSLLESFSIIGDEFWQAITDEVEGEIDYTLKLGNRKFKTVPTRMMMNKLDAKDKSDDIFKILKAHTSMANSYKFKSKVEPILTAGQQHLEELGQITKRDTVKGKVTTKNKYKETDVSSNKLVNTKKQFEHQIETFLYENYRDVEGRLGKVFLSEKDKAKKTELDELLAQEKITSEQYQTRVSTLGRQITGTGIMDIVNKYTYLRALGLPNFATPTVNLTFGLASNLTYAAGNEGTNLTDMRKAIGMYTNTILTRKGIKKLWAFMEELGILDEYNESLYGTERTLVDEMAFILQNKTEQMNRGVMMLSHLLSFKIKNKNGEDVSLYYAFKEVEGKLVWDTENFGEREEVESTKILSEHGVNMYRLKTYIGKANQRVHGDYESALRAKRTILGRSLFMFKTWMAMGLVERFGSEEFDDDLGRVVKGRYTVGWTATDSEGNKISIQKLLGIITKAAFTKEGLSGLSEVDRASVRRNLKELQFITQFSIAVAALLLVAKGADDDDEYKFALNTLINILTKAQADLAYFTNPSSALQLTNNIMPIVSTVNDIYKFLPVMYKTISGDPTYQSGPLKDNNRLLIWGAQVTPGINAGLRIWKNGQRIIQQF